MYVAYVCMHACVCVCVAHVYIHLPYWDWYCVTVGQTYNADRMVTDSAAAAGAYLCGEKIRSGMICISQDAVRGRCGDVRGNELKSILKHSHEGGKLLGFTDSNISITPQFIIFIWITVR